MSGAGSVAGLSPFVGRHAELRRLHAAMRDAFRTGRPTGILVMGEAGIGKSRMVREFLAGAASSEPGVTTLIGRCPPSDSGSAYWPLAEALREASDASLTKGTRAAAAALRRHLERLLPDASPTATELTHALAATAGLVVPRNPLDRAEPRAVDAAIRRAWPRYLTACVRPGPGILVIEDVHWADPQLLRVVESIHRDAQGPLVVVLTARPELANRHTDFPSHRARWTTVTLASLARGDSVQLVRSLLQATDLAVRIAQPVAARADGNPLYIEETLRLLVDSGAVRVGSGTTQVLDTARLLASPATINGLLAARIAALPDDERRVLQAAAIVGRRFWDGAVEHASQMASVHRLLAALEGRGLVGRLAHSTVGGQHDYAFKHALIRDAAYEATPRGRRARAHAQIGRWLESTARDRVAEVDEFIAEHYRRAVLEGDMAGAWDAHADEREELRASAFRHLVAAGAAARQRYALDRAADLHRHAVDLATTATDRAHALEELAEDFETGLRGEQAMATYLQSLGEARDPGADSERRARICMKAARTLVMRWGAFPERPDPALMDELIDEGLAAARDPATRCWLLALNGGAAIRWRSDAKRPDPIPLEERLRRTRQALKDAPGIGLPDLAGFAARILGQLEFEDGQFERSVATMRAIRPQLRRMHSKFQRALTSMYLFLSVADVQGRYADALQLGEEILELGREMSPHEHMHGTFSCLWALHHLGRWSEMPPLVDEHLEALRGEDQMACPYVRSGPLVGALTRAYLGDGRGVEAITGRITMTWDTPGLPEMLTARIATARGNPAEGRRLAERMIAAGRQPSLEENAFDVLAHIEALQALEDWDALSDVVRDAQRWERALALVQPFRDRATGLIALAAGARGPGITRLRSAATRFGRLAVRYEVARTQALLSQALPDAPGILAEAMATAEPLLAASVGFSAGSTPPVSADDALTDREVEVLGCVAEGLSNELIATRLTISSRTVERHLSNIYGKLGVGGKAARAAATAHAFQAGLILDGRPD
jgi:DNA-binding CsgD family transcriptional regulator/tetratricopeptide (TPR) repeat protein